MSRVMQADWEIDKNNALFCVPGAVLEDGGVRFTASVPTGETASLLLFEKAGGECLMEAQFPQEAVIGELRTLKVIGLPWRQVTYCFRIGQNTVCDPYARRILESPDGNGADSWRCGLDFSDYDWQGDSPLYIPYEQAVMYHLHVRNFTRHPKSKVRRKGTFLGLTEKIPYLLELGVNQVKLMPVYETQTELSLKADYPYAPLRGDRTDFWGYGPGCYFAPRRFFAATDDPVRELKDMIRALHASGIEVILEMFFTPGLSARMMLDCLTFWVREYHVDGFHIMGNEAIGALLDQDPILARTKFLLSSVPFAPKAKEERSFAECNDGFLTDMRRILKGDEGLLEAFVYRARRNPERFGVVNYLTNHDGFTLNDLVSYDNKHNEENGEQNADGANYNFSWNCGVEGPTRKRAILAFRKKQMRNAFLLMLLSHGTPMLLAGDEFGNSQGGNNNPYCLDSEVSWVDWGAYAKNADLLEFVKKAVAFRKEHPVFCQKKECRMTDYRSCGYPDLSYHSSRAWYGGFEYNSRQIGMMYCGAYAGETEFLYVAYNLHPLAQELAIPTLPAGMRWEVVIDTSTEKGFLDKPQALDGVRTKSFPARSIVVLAGRKGDNT